MKRMQSILRGFMLLVLAAIAVPAQVALATKLQTETFVVQCYDVGRKALSGQKGIVDVTRGYLDGREINTVTYDPAQIQRSTIEEHLKNVGTYVKTLEPKPIKP